MSRDMIHAGRWPLALTPEWLLDHPNVMDGAVRLYGILERLAQRTGYAYPLRKTLAERMKWSVSKVDRAVEELVAVGAIKVEHQYRAGTNILTASRYYLAGLQPFEMGSEASPSEDTPPRVGTVTGEGTVMDDAICPHPCGGGTVTGEGINGEGTTSRRETQESPNGDSDAPVTGAIGVEKSGLGLNPGAIYVDACRSAGYDPLAEDVRRVAKVAKQAREHGKPDDLVRRTCEVLADRNCGAPYFGRVLAELERCGSASNGHASDEDRKLVDFFGLIWHEQWLTYCVGDDPVLPRSRIPDIHGAPRPGGDRWRLIVGVMRHFGGNPRVAPPELVGGIGAFMVDPRVREEGWDVEAFLRRFERWVDKAARPLSAR